MVVLVRSNFRVVLIEKPDADHYWCVVWHNQVVGVGDWNIRRWPSDSALREELVLLGLSVGARGFVVVEPKPV